MPVDALCGADLFSLRIWRWLDGGSKRNLRAACRTLRATHPPPHTLLLVRVDGVVDGLAAIGRYRQDHDPWWSTATRVCLLSHRAVSLRVVIAAHVWPCLAELSMGPNITPAGSAPCDVRFAQPDPTGGPVARLVPVERRIGTATTPAEARCVEWARVDAREVGLLATVFPRVDRLVVVFGGVRGGGAAWWPDGGVRPGLFPALRTLVIAADNASDVAVHVPTALAAASVLCVENKHEFRPLAAPAAANVVVHALGLARVPCLIDAFGADRVARLRCHSGAVGLWELTHLTHLTVVVQGLPVSYWCTATFPKGFPLLVSLELEWDGQVRSTFEAVAPFLVSCCPALESLTLPELSEATARVIPDGCRVTVTRLRSVLCALGPASRKIVLDHEIVAHRALLDAVAVAVLVVAGQESRAAAATLTPFQRAAVRTFVVRNDPCMLSSAAYPEPWLTDMIAIAVGLPNVDRLVLPRHGVALAEQVALATAMDAHHHRLRTVVTGAVAALAEALPWATVSQAQ